MRMATVACEPNFSAVMLLQGAHFMENLLDGELSLVPQLLTLYTTM